MIRSWWWFSCYSSHRTHTAASPVLHCALADLYRRRPLLEPPGQAPPSPPFLISTVSWCLGIYPQGAAGRPCLHCSTCPPTFPPTLWMRWSELQPQAESPEYSTLFPSSQSVGHSAQGAGVLLAGFIASMLWGPFCNSQGALGCSVLWLSLACPWSLPATTVSVLKKERDFAGP